MRTSISSTPANKLLYSPSSFRSRLLIQSEDRSKSYLAPKRSAVRLTSPSFVWKSADSTSPQRVGLRRLGLYIPVAANGRRAKSSTPSIEEEFEEEDQRFRQSWPLARIQSQQITVVDKNESKLIIRPSSTRSYKIRRVWTSNNNFESTVEEDLKSEEDSEQRVTPKRKCNLEKDEIEGKLSLIYPDLHVFLAKRQNCKV